MASQSNRTLESVRFFEYSVFNFSIYKINNRPNQANWGAIKHTHTHTHRFQTRIGKRKLKTLAASSMSVILMDAHNTDAHNTLAVSFRLVCRLWNRITHKSCCPLGKDTGLHDVTSWSLRGRRSRGDNVCACACMLLYVCVCFDLGGSHVTWDMLHVFVFTWHDWFCSVSKRWKWI